ncbi:von Willebrand factor D and EGF domain-containing protein-like [Mya arenaria]|uniref:von Willebrand factor D and EGF domain-containing protein-like n=1 Tax=Mya arenaria TaxID=6604 RepID=UPI0022E4FF86|nr:von Willebrand factor D and EGF domain-containing protein-like [Mya arenaria]
MDLVYISSILVFIYRTQGCEDVSTLPNMDLRARNNPIKGMSGNDPIITDSFIDNGWYSVVYSGLQYVMPDNTTIPGYQTCGTYYPYYIKGIHPSTEEMNDDDIADITVCARTAYASCVEERKLKLRKCGNETQYNLKYTIPKSAYCFDPPGIGHLSEFTEPPADVDLGHMFIKPWLKFEQAINDQNEIYTKPTSTFECVFNDQGYFYTSYWYVNNKEIMRMGPSQNETHILTEETLKVQKIVMGFNVICGLRVSADKTGQRTQLNSSDSFFAGIQATEPLIYMTKTDDAEVKFKVTVPVGAIYNEENQEDLSTTLSMINPMSTRECGQLVFLSHNSRCGLEITAYTEDTINKWDSNYTYTFNISTSTTDVNGGEYFQFRLQNQNIGHNIWRGYTTDVIQIIVTDSTTTYMTPCFSHVDPHHRTFDGYSYDQQQNGTYLLYGNSAFGIEVHEMLGACMNGNAQCACGVYVRAGADAFTIDLCHETPFIDYSRCGDDSRTLLVYEIGNDYKIYTPIGSWVNIDIEPHLGYKKFMNIAVYSSPKDFNKTQGLCGLYDKNISNDMKYSNGNQDELNRNTKSYARHHIEFANSWKLNESSSLFGLRTNLQKWGNYYFDQCLCSFTSAENYLDKCSPRAKLAKNCYVYNNETEHNTCAINKGGKRDINHNRRQREYDRILNTKRNSYPRNKRQRRQLQEITEVEAFDICEGLINSSAAVDSGLFNGYLEMDSLSIAQMCTFDVMVGNDATFANVHVDAINKITKNIIEHDSAFVNNNKTVVTVFLKNSCPKNCSGNGVCSENGTCICFEFYHNIDCRTDEREQLSVLGLEGGGLCTVSNEEDCRCFYIYTTNLLKTFSCRLSGYMIYHDNTFENISKVTRTGEYKDVFTGDCCLGDETRRRRQTAKNPFYLHYRISISNDDNTFSDDKDMYVYSPQCQEAIPFSGGAYNIVLKNGYCYIDGICISDNQTHPTDECLRCLVSADVTKWTHDCLITQEETRLNGWMVAVIIVSILFVMAVIGVVVFECKNQMSKRQVSDSLYQDIIRPSDSVTNAGYMDMAETSLEN